MCGGTPRSSASCLRSRTSRSNSTSSQAISPTRCACGSGAADRPGQRDRLALLERRQALVGEFQHAELLRAVCRTRPSRISSRPMAFHSGRLCSLPMP